MGAPRAPDHGTIVLEEPIALRRRGVEAKLVLRSTPETATTPDPNLVALVARAHRWFGLLTRGTAQSIREIAEREGANESDVSLILPLALLAPDITKAILDGRQPPELTARTLKRLRPLPFAWDAQRRLLGFGVSHGHDHLRSHIP